MNVSRDGDDKIYGTISLKDVDTGLVDYLEINGVRFNKENRYQRGERLGETDPKTGHKFGCICFICNH